MEQPGIMTGPDYFLLYPIVCSPASRQSDLSCPFTDGWVGAWFLSTTPDRSSRFAADARQPQ